VILVLILKEVSLAPQSVDFLQAAVTGGALSMKEVSTCGIRFVPSLFESRLIALFVWVILHVWP
jgi:hypothetical protein